jgi:hypothetical protein
VPQRLELASLNSANCGIPRLTKAPSRTMAAKLAADNGTGEARRSGALPPATYPVP